MSHVSRSIKQQSSFAISLFAAICVMVISGSVHAQSESAGPSVLPDARQMARVEASVDQALEYLMRTQRADGSWPCKWGDNNGINAFCLLAFLGRGHAPTRGPYQPVIDKAIAHLLATQRDDGFFKSDDTSHGPMYEHALTTLALIEAYGFYPKPAMRKAVQDAVDLIVKSQSKNGGWRYQPKPGSSDLSVSVMQVVALRSAENARLHVPEKTMNKALKYVKACYKKGKFYYQPGRNASLAQTAAGVLCMHLLGAYDDPSVDKALDWMSKRVDDVGYSPKKINHFWYMGYYAMQAHFQAGGSRWTNWHPKVRRFLLGTQKADGSWPNFSRASKYSKKKNCYATALGAMTLEVYMHYLPAYQR